MDEIPLHIPTLEELTSAVIISAVPGSGHLETDERSPAPPSERLEPARHLSIDAMAFLVHAALPAHAGFSLGQHFAALDVRSGSVKERILDELRGAGLIRLELRGGFKQVHLFPAAWEVLGMTPPKGMGTGGGLHKAIVNMLASEFKARGYDVRIEFPLGPERKRVDLVAFGAKRIGIEVGLSDPVQEVRNIKKDLASGVLDLVILCSPEVAILERVRDAMATDPWLTSRSSQIQFFLVERRLP